MSNDRLSADKGGKGDRLVVLLHGLGATGAVWRGVIPLIEARGLRWIAPDLRGHGASASDGPFGMGNHAADVSALIAGEDPAAVTVLGHSFGGVVGAVLAGGLFGPAPARLIALGVKTDWTTDEVASAQAQAHKPAKVFDSWDAAQDRFLKVSGLFGLVARDSPLAARGVREGPDGFTLAMDPRVFSAVSLPDGKAVVDLLAQVQCPLTLAAGGADPMVNPATMRQIDAAARFLPDLPHNAHVADPAAVAALLE